MCHFSYNNDSKIQKTEKICKNLGREKLNTHVMSFDFIDLSNTCISWCLCNVIPMYYVGILLKTSFFPRSIQLVGTISYEIYTTKSKATFGRPTYPSINKQLLKSLNLWNKCELCKYPYIFNIYDKNYRKYDVNSPKFRKPKDGTYQFFLLTFG